MKRSFSWLVQMAWRDSRRNTGRLILFTTAIVLGVAALVAVDSFEANLKKDIDSEAQTLLGADLLIRSNMAYDSSAQALIDSIGGNKTEERTFVSMVYFGGGDSSRFVQVRALGDGYPYYGTIDAVPASASKSFRSGQRALVERSLMLQFNAQPGDSIQIGDLMFEIAGSLIQVPGQNALISSVSSPVYIPLAYLEATGLVQQGSRINYLTYFQFPDPKPELEAWAEANDQRLEDMRLRYDTVASRKERLGTAFGNLTRFLNLVGFIALLLGSIGVASSVQVYLRQKQSSIAVLRCLGVRPVEAFTIFLIQIGVMGTIGAVIGVVAGVGLQFVLPQIMGEFLPIDITIELYWPAILRGLLAGISVSILFALLPLLEVRRVAPLQAIRSAYEARSRSFDPWIALTYGGILLFVFIFSYLKIGDPIEALVFVGGLVGAFLLLIGVARGIMWLTRKLTPRRGAYPLRQGLSNLYRPNNQTLILISTIGLGALLIATLFFIQNLLLNQINIEEGGNTPNIVLYDIQPDQVEAVAQTTREQGLPVLLKTPIVTVTLEELKGIPREVLLRDSTSDITRWTLNWEYRTSYRDALLNSEEIVAGEWVPEVKPGEPIYVSLEENYAKNDIHVDIGDKITWNIRGLPVETIVGSFRKMDVSQLNPNFIVLFPKGVMERAPQIYLLSTRAETDSMRAVYQKAIARTYKNVSVIDLSFFLQTANEVLGKVSFVIQFMAFFSILTGLLVLVGSLILSRFQRIRESVLLRTLGAQRGQLWQIFTIEYFMLGSLGGLAGIMLGTLATIALAVFAFQVPFSFAWGPALVIWLGLAVLTVLIGLANSRDIVRKSPLEILRQDV
ncbi:MAG: FtsX-like permease family protein [Bacteroidota bacterium]